MYLFNAIMGITTVSTASIASTHLLMPNEFAINICNTFEIVMRFQNVRTQHTNIE